MKIISVNSGSSSLKFQLYQMPEETVIASGQVEKIGFKDSVCTLKHNGEIRKETLAVKNHTQAAKLIIDGLINEQVLTSMQEINGVGHRIVQGGEVFDRSTLVNKKVIEQILILGEMAPLHNYAHVEAINGFLKVLPDIPHVVVFDTTFHQTMKADAYMYSTPYEWYLNYGIRKYGFHGSSHKYVSEKTNELLKLENSKVIVCHIGNGASLSAVVNGKCVDTSMGFTPLEGIPMGTRTGSLDPAILSYMEKKLNVSSDEMYEILNKKSGYLGVSQLSSDARDLEEAAFRGHKQAILAFELQAKRIADYIGSYYVYMGGLDAVSFTAGIGENSPYLRKLVLERLKVLGVLIDEEANNNNRLLISSPDSKVKIYVIKTNEELVIARDTMAFIKNNNIV
ncbi:MAG: acetate kinase [Acholeplasmatales bacterium]|jgi:acetate kinase|nr:acetate kinase [Acholeplasmatales bacterium]